ncbi:MAG: DNA-directed RNA polymerase subunit beta [Clostridia bacterium]|nr:DNA-directed RNA polymerase subunit beta [Clostridia bacterium]
MELKERKLGTTIRKSFARIDDSLEMPDLIEVQKKSYEWFLAEGLDEVLHDVSPIVDYSGNLTVDFVSYSLDSTPKYSIEECKRRGVTYEAPLRMVVRLRNTETGEIKSSEIYMGNFPLMTDNGTFVINGAERVIVSQIVRSPGIYYAAEMDKTGKHSYSAQVIPYRGAWLEYETDASGIFYVKIDKNKKMPITVLVRALGADTDEAIDELFGGEELLLPTLDKDDSRRLAEESGKSIQEEALKNIYKKMRPGEPPTAESAQTLISNTFFDPKRYALAPVGRYKFDKKLAIAGRIRGCKLTRPAVSPFTGEVIAEAGTLITRELSFQIEKEGINELYVTNEQSEGKEIKVFSNGTVSPETVLGYSLKDCGISGKVRLSVLQEILEETAGDEEATKKLCRERAYDLAPRHITKDDILASINYLFNLAHGVGNIDDIDHLGNRRLRCVGELLQNQLRIGMSRMDKNIKERMQMHDSSEMTPAALINSRPVTTAIREFFGSSPLSQFMDQNNPLAELTHKRRLSALGPGGLSRDRAGFDVRDVHYTQYGRMCPIETPEGPNIGLISYLSTYARISEYGFLEAPYRKVDKERGVVTNEVEYMTADVEDNYIVAQANEPLDEEGHFINRRVIARDKSEIGEFDAADIDYMDASPRMLVSVATAMIPFLENDDNTRALMGSNMQKQAVPLMMTDSPYVGTGMEYKAAVDSGAMVIAKESGIVEKVSSDKIVILNDEGQKDVYYLIKFKRSNQSTSVNQRPIVNEGDRVIKGQVIADGPGTSNGEISLGKNALIGFMTWEGYNYEDAVLLNERLVRDDVYTSIHIEKYEWEARDTKLGPQEITREVPNVGDDALKNLDADGIVRIGTEVHANDILVGKVSPKGETDLSPEDRLLRAIFGEKAREVKDSSKRMPHGASGVVVGVDVFTRDNAPDLAPGISKKVVVYVAQKRKISVGDKMAGRHGNKGVVSRILPPEDMPFLPDGTPLDIVLNPLGVPSRMNIGQVFEVHLGIAARELGMKIMTPVFDGAKEGDIIECLREAGLCRKIRPGECVDGKSVFMEEEDESGKKILMNLDPGVRENPEEFNKLLAEGKLRVIDGKSDLYDGRTGELFDNPVTVGIMYYLKLHHLVDDKIHARSNGPYSLVTQQPLGGKAQFGGQRFGEMEVWALEAYGAAYTLQEILTVKSDDRSGRTKAFDAIVRGENIPTPGIPESFKVLVKELQSLALDIRIFDEKGEEIKLSDLIDDNLPSYATIEEVETAVDAALAGETADDDLVDDEDLEDGEYDDEYEDDLEDEGYDDFDDN